MEKKPGKFKPFEKGNQYSKGHGRPKGSRNKLKEGFVQKMLEDFDEHGVNAIIECREQSAFQYLSIIAKILPKEHNIKVNHLHELSESELADRARQLSKDLGLYGDTGSVEALSEPKQPH